MSRPTDLPDFENPPLSEVAISLQFAQLSTFSVVHAGLLWDKFKGRFPRVEYKGRLQPAFETFGLMKPSTPKLQLQLAEVPDLPRLWFVDSASSELVQFQPDRFIHNWRKVGEGSAYPRYEAIRASFLDELQTLQSFVSQHELGEITPNQCEVTYVNTLRVPQQERPFKFFQPIDVPQVGEFEDAGVTLRYRLNDSDGKPIGRITVQAVPGIDPNGENVTQLSITGRGPPSKPSIAAAMEFFDQARLAIVHTFAALTTTEMHNRWDRKV
jgi:uncharacterized protein (TIGR04255 family)